MIDSAEDSVRSALQAQEERLSRFDGPQSQTDAHGSSAGCLLE
ncbi:hypothetical protein EYF80_066115 [Liparis tanakae]|uniref:Uncharacterized protein n=1 Tax=Liparis tanakae TaxID=230148 RepID=A0A4Z2E537_9TELE|nr:hypothetical protein EYF80_066115 [Liparis tanakae]